MSLLSQYYKKAAMVPLAITAAFGFILVVTHDGSKYKSEWMSDDGFVVTILLAIVASAIIALLSLTILLNEIKAIESSMLLSLLSWIALPGSVCVLIIYRQILNFSESSLIDGVYYGSRLLDGYIFGAVCIHLLAIVSTFIHFKFIGIHQEP